MTTLRRKNSPNPGLDWFIKCSFLVEGEIHHQVCQENLCYQVARQDVGKGINSRYSKLACAAVRIAELAIVFLQEAVDCSVGSRGLARHSWIGNEAVSVMLYRTSWRISRQGKTQRRTEGSPAGALLELWDCSAARLQDRGDTAPAQLWHCSAAEGFSTESTHHRWLWGCLVSFQWSGIYSPRADKLSHLWLPQKGSMLTLTCEGLFCACI